MYHGDGVIRTNEIRRFARRCRCPHLFYSLNFSQRRADKVAERLLEQNASLQRAAGRIDEQFYECAVQIDVAE